MKCPVCGEEIKHGISQHYKTHGLVYKPEDKMIDTLNKEQIKEPELLPRPEADGKTEGVANDMVNAIEPVIRVAEKLSGQPREQFMGNVIKNLINGQIKGAFGAMFENKRKPTRLNKLKELVEVTSWIILVIMVVFWINYGIGKWMGAF